LGYVWRGFFYNRGQSNGSDLGQLICVVPPAGGPRLPSGSAYLFSQSRDMSVYKSAAEEQIELLEVQKALELRCNRTLIDLSLTETLHVLLSLSIEKPGETSIWEAEVVRLVKKFKSYKN
jgi:hypothetical protein